MANQLSDRQQHFNALWLAETIRLQEEQQGVLADSEAVRQAKMAESDLQQRILIRAQWLANKTSLLDAQQNWLIAMRWAIRILSVLACFIGVGLVLPTFSTTAHTINIFSALSCLLGINLIMLFIWLIGAFGCKQPMNQLGRFWLWLTNKLTGKQQVVQLLPAFLGLLHQKRLERWLLGRITNGLWLLTLSVALLSLLLLLATQRYGFIWQTTILSADTFVSVVHILGAIPSLLGFAVPSEALIRQSGDIAVMTDAARQTWAVWLIGVLVVYGIMPRLLLLLVCNGLWRYGYSKLKLDLTLPSYVLLKSRLLADMELIGVIDPLPEHWQELAIPKANWARQGALLVGVELEPTFAWPPTLPEGVIDAGIIDSREQRKELLEQLTVKPVAKLLIVCDPKRSIDRGTLSLLGELAHCAKETRVWLITEQNIDQQRLADWQQALDKLQINYATSESLLAWLGVEHG